MTLLELCTELNKTITEHPEWADLQVEESTDFGNSGVYIKNLTPKYSYLKRCSFGGNKNEFTTEHLCVESELYDVLNDPNIVFVNDKQVLMSDY